MTDTTLEEDTAAVDTALAAKPLDINDRVGQYVKLRDHIAELDDQHKTAMAPFRKGLEGLNNLLLDMLDQQSADSVQTQNGTVYKTKKESASIADKVTFNNFVVTQGLFDLQDVKANVTAVREFIENHQGQVPPGINFRSTFVVGVRRK